MEPGGKVKRKGVLFTNIFLWMTIARHSCPAGGPDKNWMTGQRTQFRPYSGSRQPINEHVYTVRKVLAEFTVFD